jgi:hypothetical protein
MNPLMYVVLVAGVVLVVAVAWGWLRRRRDALVWRRRRCGGPDVTD